MSSPRLSEAKQRAEIVRFCQLLHQKNYLSANDGNVSVRLAPGRILITPTGRHKGFLRPDELVVVDERGTLVEGDTPPSGEVAMHLTALRLRPDIGAVVHTHPPTCIAMSLFRDARLNGVLPEVVLSIGELPVVPYARPVSDELGEALTGYIDRHDALILERHGTLTVGSSVAEAYARTERIEHAAYVLWLAHAMGRPPLLPDAELRALKAMYERTRSDGD